MPWQQNKRTGEWREVDASGNPVGQAPRGGVVAPNPIMAGQRNRDNARQDALDAQNTAQQQRTYQLQRAKTIADLEKEGKTLDANDNIVAIPNWVPPPEPITSIERNKAINRFGAGKRLRGIAENLSGKFEAGPGKTKGVSGLGGILDFLPTEGNQSFNTAATAARGDIAQSLGLIGSQANSPQEAQMWTAPYIPNSSGYDSVTQEGIGRVDSQGVSAITTSIQMLGGVPDASGRIHPLGSPQANQILAGLGLSGDLSPLQAPVPSRQAGVTNGADNRQGVAKGDSRWVPDTEVNNTIASMYANGSSHDEIAAYAATRGYRVGPPDKAALDYARKHPGWNPYASAGRQEQTSLRQKAAASGVGGYAGGASSAMTFGLNDELYGLGSAALGGDYTKARDQFQGLKRGVADESPIGDFLGNVSGGMLLGGGGGRLLQRALPGNAGARMVSALQNNPVKSGIAYGTTYGAGESNQDRTGGAISGATGGATGGAIGKYIAGPMLSRLARSKGGQALGAAANTGANSIRNVLGRPAVQREALPQMTAGEGDISSYMGNVGSVRQNMADAADLNLPYGLADADPKLRMLAGITTRKSPEARAMAEDVFDQRFIGQADRLTNAIDERLAPITNIEERGKQLMQAGNTEAGPLYNLARNQDGGIIDDQVNAFLQTPAGRDAAKRAYEIAANEGRDPTKLGFVMNDAGEGTLANVPSFESLDLVKRGLDARLNEARNPITNVLDLEGNPQLGAINTLRSNLVSRLDQLNPTYPQAREAYGKWAKKRDALNAGQSLSSPQTLPRDVTNALPRLSSNMDEVRRGYATGMADSVGQARFSGNPYEKVMGGPNAQAKLAAIFPEQAPKMQRLYDLERDMNKTKYETIGGSPTAGRIGLDQGPMGAALEQGGNVAGLLSGAPNMGTAVKLGLQGLRFGMGKNAEKKAAQIAPILFDQNPAAMMQYLDDFIARKGILDKSANKIKRRAGLFGAFTGASVPRE